MAVFSRPRPFMENPNRQKMIQRPTTTPARQGDSFLLPLRPLERVLLRSVPSLYNHGARVPALFPTLRPRRPGLASPSPPARPRRSIHPIKRLYRSNPQDPDRPAPRRSARFHSIFPPLFGPIFFAGFLSSSIGVLGFGRARGGAFQGHRRQGLG